MAFFEPFGNIPTFMSLDWKQILPIPIGINPIEKQRAATFIDRSWYKTADFYVFEKVMRTNNNVKMQRL